MRFPLNRPLSHNRRLPAAAAIAAVTLVGAGGLLLATALLLPHLLWLSWSLLPGRAAEAAGLAWAMTVGGGAALVAARLGRPKPAANDNPPCRSHIRNDWKPVEAGEKL